MRATTMFALSLGLASSAMAQFSITPGGTNSGNGNFANGTIATSATGTGIGSANFRPTTTASTDNMFAHTWWFRAGNDTREYTFANTAVAPLTMTGSLVGNNLNTLDTGGYDFNVSSANGYTFTAQLRWQIVVDVGGPKVNYSAVINNTGASALSLSLINYCDLDGNGTAAADTYSINGAGDTFSVSDGPTSLEYRAFAPAAYQATTFSALRTLMSNTAVDNLNNTVVGSPGDFTGGFQWNLSIDPGASATVGGYVAFVPAPSSLALLGIGSLLAGRRRRA